MSKKYIEYTNITRELPFMKRTFTPKVSNLERFIFAEHIFAIHFK
jgi:hypothetical protein